MVQLKRDHPAPGLGRPDNTYWMIGGDEQEVKKKHRAHCDYRPYPLTAEEVTNDANRAERNLLHYQAYDIPELKGFLKARGLVLLPGSRRVKADYIRTLEAADDNPNLSKFMTLPAELREMVYNKYHQALPTLPPNPHQPPLVLASKQLRAEALPSYYAESTFTLEFVTGFVLPTKTQISPIRSPRAMLLSASSQFFYNNRPSDSQLARIRHLKISHSHVTDDEGRFKEATSWVVDFAHKDWPVVDSMEDIWLWGTHYYWTPVRQQFGPAIVGVLREIWARPGPGKFMFSDIRLLLGAAEKAMVVQNLAWF